MVRHPYYFLGTPSFIGDLTPEVIISRGSVFLVGSQGFISQELREIDNTISGYGLSYQKQYITPEFEKGELYAILQLDFANVHPFVK